MLKKVVLLTQFGSPHPWSQDFIDNWGMLKEYGWHLYVFTENKYKNLPDNIHIVEMSLQKFDELVEKYCGVVPKNYIDQKTQTPHKLISDYYPAYGLIFQDYFKADYWGHVNWDMVFGRLDHFIPDERLGRWEIWADDTNAINGIFTMYKNTDKVNNFFKNVPNWQNMFTNHGLFYFDETHMTEAVRKGGIEFGYPKPYPYFSYDRLPQHINGAKLARMEDGSLYEYFIDTVTKQTIVGREIASFHFSFTKEYPNVKRL